MDRNRSRTYRSWRYRLAMVAVLAGGLAACDTAEQRAAAWENARQACFASAYNAAYTPAFAAAKSREYQRRLSERLAAGNFGYDPWILSIVGLLGLGLGAEGLRRGAGRLRQGGRLAHARHFARVPLVALAVATTACVEASDHWGCEAGRRAGAAAGMEAGEREGAAAGIDRANRVAAAGHVARIYVLPLVGMVLGGALIAILLQAAVLQRVSSGRRVPRGVVTFALRGVESTRGFYLWDKRIRKAAAEKQARIAAAEEEEQQSIREALAELDAWLGPLPDDPGQAGAAAPV